MSIQDNHWIIWAYPIYQGSLPPQLLSTYYLPGLLVGAKITGKLVSKFFSTWWCPWARLGESGGDGHIRDGIPLTMSRYEWCFHNGFIYKMKLFRGETTNLRSSTRLEGEKIQRKCLSRDKYQARQGKLIQWTWASKHSTVWQLHMWTCGNVDIMRAGLELERRVSISAKDSGGLWF